MATLVLESKSNVDITKDDKSSKNLTWDGMEWTWDEAKSPSTMNVPHYVL